MSDYPQVPQQISDPISENLAKLRDLFPAAVKDGALDLQALRAELGEFAEVQPGDETYELNWVGKQAAKKETFTPLLGKTLALKGDGKNSDTSQNLYIEGDNLEALKLLRQNYFGEVKMIYIDPPYNTGEDFVYTDNFKVSEGESEEREGALSTEGKRLVKNEKSSNRFHARWLNMIYPVLRLSKDMLREDGVIFISIDENEIENLVALAKEIFGPDQLIGIFKWNKTSKAPTLSKKIRRKYEYVLCLEKNNAFYLKGPSSYNEAAPLFNSGNPHSPIEFAEGDLQLDFADGRYPQGTYGKGEKHVILHQDLVVEGGKNKNSIIITGRFKWAQDTIRKRIDAGTRVFFKTPKFTTLYYSLNTNSGNFNAPSDLLSQEECGVLTNDEGWKEVNELFDRRTIFEYCKPTTLIKYFVEMMDDPDSIILDFFSGSATTAHAVMQINAEDGGARRYIMVQLPEVCAPDSEAAKAGYKTIAEIGKERIRRAGEKIKEELKTKHADWKKKQAAEAKKGGKLALNEDDEAAEETNPYVLDPDSLDIGFKSFRIEDTKINWLKKDLRGEQLEFDDTSTKDALDFVPGFTDTDVVYELMLRQSNIPLTGAITQPAGTGKRTYLYADAYLVCLEENVTRKLVEALAAIEPTPNKYFFRDSAFGKDIALKDETFRRLKAEIHKHHGDLGTAYTVEFI
jgi:adenine-specific DNA-methyltransferase